MNTKQILGGVVSGVGLTYFLDAHQGRRRRALLRNRLTHASKLARDMIGTTRRDSANRLRGAVSAMTRVLRRDAVSDDVLVERVRAKLGRVVSHPHAIDVAASNGRVVLRGPILASEVTPLLEGVSSVRGVTGVEHHLEPHERAGDVPSLQGGRSRPGEVSEFMQSNWSPAARLLAAVAGGGLALYGMRRRGLGGATLGALGGCLFTRGVTNRGLRELVGYRGERGVSVQRTITIQAPVDRVYELWRHHEEFPHFMSRVREVKDLGEGRYRWTVAGPARVAISWVGRITRQVPNELLEFSSEPGSVIDHHGVVRFETRDGGTRVDVKLSYRPPGGVVGHAVAKLFGADPRSEMVDDLMRMKSFIETGGQPHDAAGR